MNQDPDTIKADIEETRASMSDTVEALAYKTDVPARAKEAIGDRVSAMKDAVSSTLGSAKEAVTDVRDSASESVSNARDAMPSNAEVKERFERVRSLVAHNPLGLAAGSLAAGFLLGLLVPVSAVGPLGEKVVEGAKDAAADALDQGKAAVVQAVGEALAGNPTA
jgi:ElaB/YqjD/DUF883 family membrane-anchored ribosome-binding protein